MQALAHGAFPASTARRGLPDPGTGTTLRSGAGTSMSSTASTGAATRCPTAARGHRSPTTVPRGGHGTASAVEPDRGPLRSASATTIGRSRPRPDAPARRGTPPHPDEDLSMAGVGQAVQRLGGDPPRPARWRSAGFPTQVSPEVMTGLGSGTGADRQNRTGRLRRCPASGVAARCRMPAATAGGPPRVPPSHRLSSSRRRHACGRSPWPCPGTRTTGAGGCSRSADSTVTSSPTAALPCAREPPQHRGRQAWTCTQDGRPRRDGRRGSPTHGRRPASEDGRRRPACDDGQSCRTPVAAVRTIRNGRRLEGGVGVSLRRRPGT